MTPPLLSKTVSRFQWLIDDNAYGDRDYDQVCIDRRTGQIVVRYDLGDPANYDPNYGGWSRSEYLERKGFDPTERMPESEVAPMPRLYRDDRGGRW